MPGVAQVLGVFCELFQGLLYGFEQDVCHDRWVVAPQVVER